LVIVLLHNRLLFGDRAIKRLKQYVSRSLYRNLYDKDVVILIDAKEAIEGIINNRYKNILVYNFWSMLSGLLSDKESPFINIGGALDSIRTYTDFNAGAAFVVFGTGTLAENFTQASLANRVETLEGSTISPSIVTETDRIRVRFGRVTADTVQETGLYQIVYSTGGATYGVMYGRKVIPDTPGGRQVRYDIVLFSPFVTNMANLLLGILADTNRTIKDVSGSNYTARTSLDVNIGGAYLAIGRGTNPFSFNDINLTGRIDLVSSANNIQSPPTRSLLSVSGAVRLTSAMNITEIGLLQPLYDIAGGTRPTLLARIILPTAIPKDAGDVFTAVISILAGT
jgi:hypothetical protein